MIGYSGFLTSLVIFYPAIHSSVFTFNIVGLITLIFSFPVWHLRAVLVDGVWIRVIVPLLVNLFQLHVMSTLGVISSEAHTISYVWQISTVVFIIHSSVLIQSGKTNLIVIILRWVLKKILDAFGEQATPTVTTEDAT